MNIAGIVKSSFIDYPGCASTVVFLGGCNFRCGYCHNPEIVTGGQGEISLPDFFEFLQSRRRFVDAVCISGGEPTLHPELYDFIEAIHGLGYLVKLDTNGTNSKLLSRLLVEGLISYIAMDIKGPWEKYGEIAGLFGEAAGPSAEETGLSGVDTVAAKAVEAVKQSLELLKAFGGSSNFSYELRTTVCKELLSRRDIEKMAEQLAGAHKWYLQPFKKQGKLLSDREFEAYNPMEMEELRQIATQVSGGRIGQILLRD